MITFVGGTTAEVALPPTGSECEKPALPEVEKPVSPSGRLKRSVTASLNATEPAAMLGAAWCAYWAVRTEMPRVYLNDSEPEGSTTVSVSDEGLMTCVTPTLSVVSSASVQGWIHDTVRPSVICVVASINFSPGPCPSVK